MAILDKAPDGAQVLDLGAARAARNELRKDKSYLKLTAGFVEVKPEVPLEAGVLFKQEAIREGLAMLLADATDADVLLAEGLSAQDLREIVLFISGNSLGE